jgi:hypothetical protein
VNVITSSLTLAGLLVFTSWSRVEYSIIESMDGHVEHTIILIEDIPSAVTHMDIPVENAHLFNSKFLLCIPCCHRNVVKEAETCHV